jgi:hypothetical protein
MASRARRRTIIGGQFAPRLIEMLESPAWRVLSLSARRLLDRIEIEHAHHGGADNGRLPVTYDDFEYYGIDRHSIGPAIREAVALGFLEVTERGRAGNREFRSPSRYRLTYLGAGRRSDQATHEWRRIDTIDRAEEIRKMSRSDVGEIRRPGRSGPKKQKSNGEIYQVSVEDSPTESAQILAGKSPLLP